MAQPINKRLDDLEQATGGQPEPTLRTIEFCAEGVLQEVWTWNDKTQRYDVEKVKDEQD